ncbi:hypothetical protein Tco_0012706 [Tanacetum coccineum]
MHNNIMAASLRDRSPMLVTGRYAQWQSRQPVTDDSPTILPRTVPETFLNISPENKAQYDAEPEAINLILTGIGDDIYSTIDACKIAHDIAKKEVNEIRADKIAKNANPLALVVVAQQYPDTYYQAPKSHKSHAPPSKQSSYTRSHATTINKGKEIAKPVTHPFESVSKEDEVSDPKQAQRDEEMQKNLALIEKKPKRAKDYTYHKEKMLMCKQAEKGVSLRAEQSDWIDDTDEEIDEQKLEAHYNFMAKIQDVLNTELGSDAEPLEKVQFDVEYNVFANERQHFDQTESINDTYVVEKDESNVILDSSDMCDNDNQVDQNAEECDDEHAVLANLIANLKLDTDENKKIQKQLKKANTSLAHELQECKYALEK